MSHVPSHLSTCMHPGCRSMYRSKYCSTFLVVGVTRLGMAVAHGDVVTRCVRHTHPATVCLLSATLAHASTVATTPRIVCHTAFLRTMGGPKGRRRLEQGFLGAEHFLTPEGKLKVCLFCSFFFLLKRYSGPPGSDSAAPSTYFIFRLRSLEW